MWNRLGIQRLSTPWHAIWVTIAFISSLTVWILESIYDFLPYRETYEGTSYSYDWVEAAPLATIVLALLTVGVWIAWWRGRKPREPRPSTFEDLRRQRYL